MRTLNSVTRFTEGKGSSLFLLVLGFILVITGLYADGFFHVGMKSVSLLSINLQIYIGFGMMILWGGLEQAKKFAKFGKPEAKVTPDAITPGEEFEFSYKMLIHRDTEIEYIGVFLVLRERVRYYDVDEWTIKDVDRLFQKYIQTGRKYRRHDTIEIRHAFRLPMGDVPFRNLNMDYKDAKIERMWVMKVRIHMGHGEELWHEYGLEVASRVPERYTSELGRFEVMLNKVSTWKLIAITNTMNTVLPHLRDGQIGDLYLACPSLLLENVTPAEAQQVKELLEAVGAEVEIRPATNGFSREDGAIAH